MIGHFLLSIPPLAEDRVLTGAMGPLDTNEGPCLLQTIHKGSPREAQRVLTGFYAWPHPTLDCTIGVRFDELCHRFGIERVTRAIRNRILSNRVRRVLGNALECGVPAPQEPQV